MNWDAIAAMVAWLGASPILSLTPPDRISLINTPVKNFPLHAL